MASRLAENGVGSERNSVWLRNVFMLVFPHIADGFIRPALRVVQVERGDIAAQVVLELSGEKLN